MKASEESMFPLKPTLFSEIVAYTRKLGHFLMCRIVKSLAVHPLETFIVEDEDGSTMPLQMVFSNEYDQKF